MAVSSSEGAFVSVWDGWNLLIVHHAYGQRKWSLPGGGIQPEESPAAAACRETNEETGQVIEIVSHLATFELVKSPGVVHLFEGQLVDGRIRPFGQSPEITRVAWLAPELFWERLYPAQQKLAAWSAYFRKLRDGGATNGRLPRSLIEPPINPLLLPLP